MNGYHSVERRRLESELWACEARLTALLDTASDAILVINGRSGLIQRVNHRAIEVLGYTMQEMVGDSMEMLVPEDTGGSTPAFGQGFSTACESGEMGYHPLIDALCKDGSMVSLDIALTATSATDDVMVVCHVAASVVSQLSSQEEEA